MNHDTVLDSCTILMWMKVHGIKKESSLDYHTDTKCNLDGKFYKLKMDKLKIHMSL